MTDRIFGRWSPDRPQTMVVACSDGRLQEATDTFLHTQLGLAAFDRFYVPGGGGALSPGGSDALRARQLREECRYLIELHRVRQIVLLFHGPAADGPADAVCADYRRKMPSALAEEVRRQQAQDAAALLGIRDEWTEGAAVSVYRCEVGASGAVTFRSLDAEGELSASEWGSPFD